MRGRDDVMQGPALRSGLYFTRRIYISIWWYFIFKLVTFHIDIKPTDKRIVIMHCYGWNTTTILLLLKLSSTSYNIESLFTSFTSVKVQKTSSTTYTGLCNIKCEIHKSEKRHQIWWMCNQPAILTSWETVFLVMCYCDGLTAMICRPLCIWSAIEMNQLLKGVKR